MSIDEKLTIVRKALEMGAYVEVKFHGLESEEEALNITADLKELVKEPFEKEAVNGSCWFQSNDFENKVEAVVYFKA